MALYTYTNKDLLEQPEYYMYGRYHGKTFLNEYMTLREIDAKSCEDAYLTFIQNYDNTRNEEIEKWLIIWDLLIDLKADFFSLQTRKSYKFKFVKDKYKPNSDGLFCCPIAALDKQEELHTQSVMFSLLSGLIKLELSQKEDIDRWLNKFVRQFEMQKKIYEIYSHAMNPKSNDYHIFTNYALLSLNAILHYEHSHNLKMLNTAVKLNDILSSNRINLHKPEDLFFTLLAMRNEVFCVKKIAEGNGVKI